MSSPEWPPPNGVCPMPDCNGIITGLAMQLDPRGEGECGRCGNYFAWRDGRWIHVDELPDKPNS